MSLIFVYATKENVSEYTVKSGITYRAVTDHLGSPSMVINATSGEIISHFDYDEYGNVIYDTNIMIYTLDIASVFVPFSSIYPF